MFGRPAHDGNIADLEDVAPMGSRRRAGSKLLMDGGENLLEDDGMIAEPIRSYSQLGGFPQVGELD